MDAGDWPGNSWPIRTTGSRVGVLSDAGQFTAQLSVESCRNDLFRDVGNSEKHHGRARSGLSQRVMHGMVYLVARRCCTRVLRTANNLPPVWRGISSPTQ